MAERGEMPLDLQEEFPATAARMVGTPESAIPAQVAATDKSLPSTPIRQTVQLGEEKPLFFEGQQPGSFNINPFGPGSQGGVQTRRLDTTQSVDFDPEAAKQRQEESTGQVESALDEGREARKQGLVQQGLANMGVQSGLQVDLRQTEQRLEAEKKAYAALEATKPDASDWWRDGGTGRTVGALFALAAGGFVNAIRPGSNNIAEQIYGAIDRYVQNKVADKNSGLQRRAAIIGDLEMAKKTYAADIRKLVLDQGQLAAQMGTLDAEMGKTLAQLYHQNVKDYNSYVMTAADRHTVQEQEVVKPGATVPWQAQGMDQKRWDKFTSGEGKEAGAVSLISSMQSNKKLLAELKKMAKEHGGDLPGFGAFSAMPPDVMLRFADRLGIDAAGDAVRAKQMIGSKILEVIQGMNSRLIDSNVEGERFRTLVEKGSTESVIHGLEDLQGRSEKQLKDLAAENAVPGVDPNDMIRYAAQGRGQLEPPAKDAFQVIKPGTGQPLRPVGPDGVPETLRRGPEEPPPPPPEMLRRPSEAVSAPGFEKKSPEFKQAFESAVTAKGWDPEAVKALIEGESGFNPGAVNKLTDEANRFAGLNQIDRRNWNKVARRAGESGVSFDEYRQMSDIEQLPFMIASLELQGVKPGDDAGTIALRNSVPAAVGLPDDTVIARKGSRDKFFGEKYSEDKVWEQNPGWRDGDVITVGSVKKHYTRKMKSALFTDEDLDF